MKSIKTFSRQELYDLVWSKPLSTIAKENDISFSAIKKICKDNNVPYPGSGYWSKIKFNKEVVKIPLPQLDDNNEISFNEIAKKEVIELKPLSEKQQLKEEIENILERYLKVPERLVKPHKLIVEAKNDLKNKKSSHFHNTKGLICTSKEVFNINVGKKSIKRALLFSDRLIKLLIKRGHKVVVRYNEKYYNHNGTFVIVDNEPFKIGVRETRKRIIEKGKYWNNYDYIPSGLLTLRIEEFHGYEWKDTKRDPLENKLSKIIVYLELRAASEKKERIEREMQRIENERKRKIEEEIQKRKELELVNVRSLIHKSQLWKKADDLRNYIEEIEVKAIKKNNLTEELKNWLRWANQKADWYDPLVEKEDELLEQVDKDKLEFQKSRWC
ncbi:MAG: hypothetical protein L3J34_04185 [Flavobacteriaceae bacterium]|nr:hypothetical protein [Flavobacteriaceae bacterium]